MRLYFLRHGIADWPDWDPARDHERPLTKDGLKKMKEQAKTLADLDVKFDAILSSPYTRAYQTADIVAGKLGLEVKTEPLLAPGFNSDKLAEIVEIVCRRSGAAADRTRTEFQHGHCGAHRRRARATEERRAGAGGRQPRTAG